VADANDPGLLTSSETALLTDLYELAMSASYLRRGLNDRAAFELFARRLPPRRDWLLTCGLGPTLRLIAEIRFGDRELAYLEELGYRRDFLDYLREFRFSGDIEAMPEGTLAFADEPLLRVTAPRIEAQLIETLVLNQINFQTLIATKAARVVLAAGGGEPGAGDRVLDFSPRRDHGIDAAMKAARASAIAGCGGTSNVAAAMRYGLRPVGTMAHSYVLSFAEEGDAFRAFLTDGTGSPILLVDTYDTAEGVRRAIAASRDTGVPLEGIRLDSGDLDALSREARALLDDAGMRATRIVASGDLEEDRIAALVTAGAPIDLWGVGTELGTSRDSPVVNGVYKLVADQVGSQWRGVAKSSLGKATAPCAKQVFRSFAGAEMRGDVIGVAGEELEGEPLLVPAMASGEVLVGESIDRIRERATRALSSLPPGLRRGAGGAYPVRQSEALGRAIAAGTWRGAA
jgi:nicotinate phosphoribosyltransferase